MEGADYLVIPYFLMVLGLGSALVQYLSFRKKKLKIPVKIFKNKYK